MAHQYISIKVSGNQISSTGFVPLLLYNNPDIDIPDKGYVGFDSCSYFYTITTNGTQNVFKLVKNNVRSSGAIRPGNLVIAFSIPKHYKLDNGYTPYDVLEKLKNEFLKKCMTCKDPVRETYEFNPGRIDQQVLDEVASEFTISPQPSPDRVMNPSAPKGYIVKSDVEIEKLFHDVNYPEFDNYSEVIIAETVNQTSYIPINDIQIPRLKSYAIYVDGVYKMACADVNQILTASSQNSQDYYDNKSFNFSIQKLKDGDIFPGIELQEVNERIDISTKGWATPKTRTIELHIVPREFENYFFTNRHLLKLTGTHGRIELDENLSFTLVGEEIAEIKTGTIKLELEQNGKYSLSKFTIYGNELRITVEEIKRQPIQNVQGTGPHRYQPKEKVTDLQSQKTSPVYDVSISLKGKEKFKESYEIDLKLKTRSDKSYETIASYRTRFKSISKDVFEGHFYVPKDNLPAYLYLCFKIDGNKYETKLPLIFNNGKSAITENDFTVSKVKPFYKKTRFLIKLLILLVAILLGLVIGYVSHDYIKKLSHEPQPSNNMLVDDPEGEDHPSMTEDEAFAFLKDADSTLKIKDLKFDTVDVFYNKYQTNNITIDKVDKENFDNKVCGRIKDYNTVASCIQNGNVEGLNGLKVDSLHIWPQHKTLVEKIQKNNQSFMDNYSNINGFADIEKFIQLKDGTDEGTSGGSATGSGAQGSFICDKCSMSFTSQSVLNSHKNSEHSPQNRFTCSKCGTNVYFKTKKELDNHIKIHHNER